jgi:hypothetical protein
MEQRLSLVTLGVEDLGRARKFYESLGWRALAGPEGVVFFQLPGLVFALWSRAALAEDAGLADAAPSKASGGGAPEARPNATIALAHNVRERGEVAAVLAEAREAGAAILKDAADTFWGGHSGYFADPDGHVWEVAWNPHWTIDDDGATRASR